MSRDEWEQLDIPNICDVEVSDSSSSEESEDEDETEMDAVNNRDFHEGLGQVEDDKASESGSNEFFFEFLNSRQ